MDIARHAKNIVPGGRIMDKQYRNMAWIEKIIAERVKDTARVSVAIQELHSPVPVLYDNRMMPSASLIKIPIMAAAFRRHDEGKFDLAQVVSVYDAVEGGSFYTKQIKEVTWQEAVFHMIVESDNTCTNMLIDALGMERINAEIERLHLRCTRLQRKMMDFDAAKRGKENWTSPEDMARMLWLLGKKQWLGTKRDTQMLYILSCQEDNCILPAQLRNDIRVAHKTGELDGIYHDCGIIYKEGAPYVCCIMADNIADEARAIYDLSYVARHIYDAV